MSAEGGYVNRPRISAVNYGLPMRCPVESCGYSWLKLPGLKMHPCPNCGSVLLSRRPKKMKFAMEAYPSGSVR